ncbi:MAG: hypothetical protein AB7M12_01845 [Hyphomonadaceae bacterium]
MDVAASCCGDNFDGQEIARRSLPRSAREQVIAMNAHEFGKRNCAAAASMTTVVFCLSPAWLNLKSRLFGLESNDG